MNVSSGYFASPADPGTLAGLRRRLALAAEAEGLLDVAYTTFDSPVGRLLLAATPTGLVRVAYDIEDHDRVLDSKAPRDRAHEASCSFVIDGQPGKKTSSPHRPGHPGRSRRPLPQVPGLVQ